jgi:DNA-binding response OmpR family regulator
MTRVMIVDDSAIVTKMVSKYLLEKGYEVEVANSPFGVSGRIKEYKPDVLLMDLGLPGLSGEKLIDLCKKCEECARTRVVLFSSSDEQNMKDLVKKGVAHDYFMKGSSLRELEDKMRT